MATIKPDYTVRQARELLSCGTTTIYKLINEGNLKTYKLGRGVRIKQDSVEALRSGQLTKIQLHNSPKVGEGES